MTPLIIDIEASGFGDDSYPIEVGVALDDGEKYCTLIAPDPCWTHWDKEAEDIHHVTREMLEVHGSPIDDVAAQLNKLLAGKTLFTDGWVVDKPWLITLFHAARRQMQFSVSPLEMILSEGQMGIWQDTKKKVIEELELTRHRASNDAWIIQETYRQTFLLANKTGKIQASR